MIKHLNILGTRGIPAAHGGFETFAERLALHLVSRGIGVTVYCQSPAGEDRTPRRDIWHGVERVHIGPKSTGALGTLQFDFACARHALGQPGVDLVLGYNTAVFNLMQKLRGRKVLMNMDGVEWSRRKWSLPARTWLMMNEQIGAWLSDQPIADHPQIARHLGSRCRVAPVVIPYGADPVSWADPGLLEGLGVRRGQYFVSIARLEPDNGVAELVAAHAISQCRSTLLVLGRMDHANPYCRKLRKLAGPNVRFAGAIYDKSVVRAIRYHCRAYLHGHQVGGTNPSLVEALAAGNPIIAHDNPFNRWTAGQGQAFYGSVTEAAAAMARLDIDDLAAARAGKLARQRHAASFQWDSVLYAYERLIFGRAAPLDVTVASQVAAG